MKRVMVLIIMGMLMAGSLQAQDKWTTKDTWYEAAYIALTVCDWRQAHDIISRSNEGHSEANPILGPHPSHGEINILIPLTIIAHAFFAYKLDQPYRRAWQIGWSGVEIWAVNHNYHAGLNIRF